MNTVIRHVTAADLDRCYAIETLAYEGDEAATREKIATRIATWPDGFIVAVQYAVCDQRPADLRHGEHAIPQHPGSR